ncbi:pyruvate, phosphate dikinase [Amycolatopsis cynarae]|uniref:Pyruvate, phosphate dikinase n=1 Tax=Amycolatopsis cynarae TaxID=2995223 RepID=A0ABY7B076_9PSEU|nr:pyruvate, phosphate dikinase [Amycolatopsis sp. HUAS 11-8]WAL64321.1 pyruvate, phosphate dikinase [Amycolatopsis sp. HUAS 11-8]
MAAVPVGAPDPADLLILDGSVTPPAELAGGKAAGIAGMTAAGLPVPPAFVLTTGVCRRFLTEGGGVLDALWGEMRQGMAHLESATGRRFGDPAAPLLVSVRSGAPTSMPGMMDTVLNLGMTTAVRNALSISMGETYARDTQERFAQLFRDVVLRDDQAAIPDDPWRQLRLAVEAVFRSWLSPRAVVYRKRHGLDDTAGTAVTVQAMVFGNADERSGTGVLFTRNPSTGAPEPFGEWMTRAQGEDVVSGTREPQPLSALAELMPDVHARLLEHARFLERHHRDVQDIEFTVESGRLWLLQTRSAKRAPRAAVRFAAALGREGLVDEETAVRMVTAEQVRALVRPGLDPEQRAAAVLLARGLPACPGVASGVVVTDPEEAESRAAEGESVVLARRTTSPHDLAGMMAAVAIVTEIGGATSHAAVVGRELGVPCVVGCGEGALLGHAGETVTVCGDTGEVLKGALVLTRVSEGSDPDLRALTGWARRFSPLAAWRPEEAPAGVLPRPDLDLSTDQGVAAALADGVTAVVTEHPLPVLLAALAHPRGSAKRQ